MRAPQFAFSVGLAAWLALSLAGKLTPTLRSEAASLGPLDELVAHLNADGFSVEKNTDPEVRMLAARRGECRLAMLLISPMGWQVRLAERLAWPGATVTFSYRGSLTSEFPVWTARLEHFRERLMAYVRQRSAPVPSIGIIADSHCPPADRLIAGRAAAEPFESDDVIRLPRRPPIRAAEIRRHEVFRSGTPRRSAWNPGADPQSGTPGPSDPAVGDAAKRISPPRGAL